MKKVIIISFLCFTVLNLFSINPPIEKKENAKQDIPGISPQPNLKNNIIYPEWGFYIDASAGISKIQNKNISEIFKLDGGLGYTFSAGYFRSLSPSFRLKSGVEVSGYNTSLIGNGVAPSAQLKDIDNDIYTESLTVHNAKNDVNLTYLSIPFILELGNLNINKIGFYADFGLKYSFLISEKFKSNGTYSTKGYYEQWGLTLENIEELGYYSDKNLQSDGSFKKSNLSIIGGLGITIPLSSVVIFKAGLSANLGLNDIGNNQPEKYENMPITVETYEYRSKYINNSLAVNKGSKTRFVGFELGFYINKLLR